MATTTSSPAASTISSSSSPPVVGGTTALSSAINVNAAQFREIHKNTWLKRLTAEGKKITVGPKKSERSWVVFCVHDDTEALLEGYAEPRHAASHSPEWIVSMRDTLHISHALIPNSHEFEFVITLSNEVLRFHAMSWETMQEWVDTLRSKLREMKIISPKENLYTKLPEVRAPLLPTRDPTSPLPAPPPVPAAIVPGVERVMPHNAQEESSIAAAVESTNIPTTTTSAPSAIPTSSQHPPTSSANNHLPTQTPILTSMSNTLTQNLLNMLSNPISAYSEQLHDEIDDITEYDENNSSSANQLPADELPLLLRRSNAATFSSQNLPETSSTRDNALNANLNRSSADTFRNLDNFSQCEIPRPHTSRSLSAGAADKAANKRQIAKLMSHHHAEPNNVTTTCSTNNITELEIDHESTTRTSLPSSTFPIEITEMTTTTSTVTATATDSKRNVTIIQVSTNNGDQQHETVLDLPPKLPTKNTAAEIFKFPESLKAATDAATKPTTKQHDYKSNVQIIPSNNNSNTIQVVSQQHQNETSAQKQPSSSASRAKDTKEAGIHTDNEVNVEGQKITTVHVTGDSVYGTCFSNNITTTSLCSTETTPKLSKKIILSANTSGVTNITVNNSSFEQRESVKKSNPLESTVENEVRNNVGSVHYDKVFLSTSSPAVVTTQTAAVTTTTTATTTLSSTTATTVVTSALASTSSPKLSVMKQWNSPRRSAGAQSTSSTQTASQKLTVAKQTPPSSPENKIRMQNKEVAANSVNNRSNSIQTSTVSSHVADILSSISPVMMRRRIASPTISDMRASSGPIQPPPPQQQQSSVTATTRPPLLTRGLTEALITTRPSRRDFNFSKLLPSKSKTKNPGCSDAIMPSITSTSSGSPSTNNNGNGNRISSDSTEVRKRSSSTSDTARNMAQHSTNNNEFSGNRTTGNSNNAAVGLEVGGGNNMLCIQQPPHRFRNVLENSISNNEGVVTSSPVAKRMTLREQQILQLRREILHPGGVRLQLRRKDCVGSIAWVDAFGAVWVAGWKQKEHPVLYNALHIGDQLLTIAGLTINTAAEANKIIRNTNTLFVEVLVRRIPFGRGYAIRREREGQCLGLIRDGNSTIVDVVPNSLAARHGLPPKAQSCDGSTLTFWVLTEINGRPLNLFFKDNEIRDRLNSVGRDISILVQPSDLIAKLKKQLKSLRGYKDYLVQ